MSDKSGKYTRTRGYKYNPRPTTSGAGYQANRGYFPQQYVDNSRLPANPSAGGSTLRPANAATAYFRRYRPNPLAFGRKPLVAQAARSFGLTIAKTATAGFLGPFLFTGGAEELVNLIFLPSPPEPDGVNRYPTNGYWEKRYGDFGPYTNYLPAPPSKLADRRGPHTWHEPLTGQALANMSLVSLFTPSAVPDGWTEFGYWYIRTNPATRYAHHSSYFKKADALDPTISSHKWADIAGGFTAPAINPMPNPNIVRGMPPAPIRDPIEKARDDDLAVAEALADPDWWSGEEIGVFIPDFHIGGPKPKVDGAITIDTTTQVGLMPPPVQPHDRAPPKSNTREGKAKMSGFARFGVGFFRGLDLVSESAEVIDAIFKALPPDVQARWSKGRKKPWHDQVGQYGTGGFSWKLEALWHNWHKVDYDQAVKNIIANEIEDQLHGKYNRFKDKLLQRGEHRHTRSKSDHFTSELVGQGFYQAESQFFKTVYGK